MQSCGSVGDAIVRQRGVISFMGPIGAGIGATYFIGKLGYEYFSGNTVFEKPQ